MNWKTVRLGDIATEDRRIIPPESAQAASLPFLGLDQIESGTGRVISYQSSTSEGKSATFAFDETHVLYGKLRPYLNKVALPDRCGRCSTEVIPLLPQDVDREFLAYQLRTDAVVNAAMSGKTGSRMPRADMDALLDFEITIPESIADQRRIVAQLNAQLTEVTHARQAVQTQLADATALRQRLLHHAFDALADAPQVQLRNVADVVPGFAFSEVYQGYTNFPIPFIKVSDFARAQDSWVPSAANTVDEAILKTMRAKSYPPGTIIFPKVGGALLTNKRARIAVRASFDNNVMGLIPRDIDGDYLYWFMCQFDMAQLANTQALPSVRASDVGQIKIPAPSIDGQRRLAAQLKAQLAEADALRAALEQQQRDLHALPQRLLAAAFEH